MIHNVGETKTIDPNDREANSFCHHHLGNCVYAKRIAEADGLVYYAINIWNQWAMPFCDAPVLWPKFPTIQYENLGMIVIGADDQRVLMFVPRNELDNRLKQINHRPFKKWPYQTGMVREAV